LAASSALAAQAVRLTGAGATFPYPIYSKWFAEYQKLHPEAQINYQSIGSGGGIRQMLARTVDFGASDAPMSDAALARSATPILHIPTVMGAVVITYNLPEVRQSLRLTGDVIADIFLGRIVQWNDARIASLNPGAKLPDEPILVAHRSDGSGTTAIFSDYLAKLSPEWKEKVGSGTALKWPVGLGGKGNEGVTGLVKQTPGGLGYVELIYAEQNQLPVAILKNRAGQFVEPSVKSVTAAAAGALKTIPADFRVSITDAGGKEAYPISAFTYILAFETMPASQAKVLKNFLLWAVSDGQKMAPALSYAALPGPLVSRIEKRIAQIH
jgi:phosphate transport system substrate-binding protein